MPMDASKLTVAVEEEERWKRTLQITVPADLVREQREEVARTLSSRMKLPGFRKGKVPASVVEKRFGPALQQETMDRVIQEAYREALRREAIHPISEGQVDKVEHERDQDLSFRVTVEVSPQVEVSRLGGFTVERPRVEVGDEDVDKVLERLRSQQGVWKPVEEGTPGETDQVRVHIVQLKEAEEAESQEYELTLGEGEAIPDVEEAIRTLEVGETGEFTVHFPEDFPNEERRGDAEELRITLEDRKVKELPELDDAFAKAVGDFESLDALRDRVRKDLQEELEEDAEAQVRARLVDLLLEANPFEVPESMVEKYVESYLGDTGQAPPEEIEKAKENIRPQAERAVKRALLVDRVAETQTIEATSEEVDEKIQEIAEKNEVDPGEVYSQFQKTGRLQRLERELLERKVFEFLKERSTIVDAK